MGTIITGYEMSHSGHTSTRARVRENGTLIAALLIGAEQSHRETPIAEAATRAVQQSCFIIPSSFKVQCRLLRQTTLIYSNARASMCN